VGEGKEEAMIEGKLEFRIIHQEPLKVAGVKGDMEDIKDLMRGLAFVVGCDCCLPSFCGEENGESIKLNILARNRRIVWVERESRLEERVR